MLTYASSCVTLCTNSYSMPMLVWEVIWLGHTHISGIQKSILRTVLMFNIFRAYRIYCALTSITGSIYHNCAIYLHIANLVLCTKPWPIILHTAIRGIGMWFFLIILRRDRSLGQDHNVPINTARAQTSITNTLIPLFPQYYFLCFLPQGQRTSTRTLMLWNW